MTRRILLFLVGIVVLLVLVVLAFTEIYPKYQGKNTLDGLWSGNTQYGLRSENMQSDGLRSRNTSTGNTTTKLSQIEVNSGVFNGQDLFEVNQTEKIPKLIHQTYSNITKIPRKIEENMNEFASDYKRKVYDDNECRSIIKKYFHHKVAQSFEILQGPHRADLFRYCILYLFGGVYADIKTELIKNLNTIINHDENMTFIVLNFQKNHIYNGIIATPPRNSIFLDLISFMIANNRTHFYHLFCLNFFDRVKQDIGSFDRSGLVRGDNKKYYVFQENCSQNCAKCYDGCDRHGLCCYVMDKGKAIIKTRYADYPW